MKPSEKGQTIDRLVLGDNLGAQGVAKISDRLSKFIRRESTRFSARLVAFRRLTFAHD
jgi:hypothetical protein